MIVLLLILGNCVSFAYQWQCGGWGHRCVAMVNLLAAFVVRHSVVHAAEDCDQND